MNGRAKSAKENRGTSSGAPRNTRNTRNVRFSHDATAEVLKPSLPPSRHQQRSRANHRNENERVKLSRADIDLRRAQFDRVADRGAEREAKRAAHHAADARRQSAADRE